MGRFHRLGTLIAVLLACAFALSTVDIVLTGRAGHWIQSPTTEAALLVGVCVYYGGQCSHEVKRWVRVFKNQAARHKVRGVVVAAIVLASLPMPALYYAVKLTSASLSI